MNLFPLCIALSLTLPLSAAPIDIPNLGASDCKDIFRNHPSDAPFTTEVAFMSYCDHRVRCVDAAIDPDAIHLGDTVFVADWYLAWFYKTIHPLIKHPYILVSGDSDGMHPWWDERPLLYDPKIAAWFTKNLTLNHHPKCRIWSHGPTLAQWRWHAPSSLDPATNAPISNFEYFSKLCKKTHDKVDYPLVYLRVSLDNHPIRKDILHFFQDKDFCYSPPPGVSRVEYWDSLVQLQFVLAPRGIGVDTCRAWEAIALGTIPIVQHSLVDAAYEGTPMALVHSWGEVTPEFLQAQKTKIDKGIQEGSLKLDKLYFAYWANEIEQVKKAIQENTWNQSDLELTKFSPSEFEILSAILLKNTGAYNHLIVCGDATALRPFQLIHLFGAKFCKTFVCDPHAFEGMQGKDTHFARLANFSKDDGLFSDPSLSEKFKLTAFGNLPKIVAYEKDWLFRVFMDLTYAQYNFTEKLEDLYYFMPGGTVICGNRSTDPYVQELLGHFTQQHPYIFLEVAEGFWHFKIPSW